MDAKKVKSNAHSTGLQVVLICLAAALLFIPFLGGVHLFDWDEINFAESAREMIASGDYLTVQINFEPFWEKPPLFIWMQVLSMKIFGISEFAARFPNAVCGIASLLVLYHAGRKIYDARFGLLWVLAYAGSLLPFLYFKSGIIDPWFNLFIFSSLYLFILHQQGKERNRIWKIMFSAGLAGLAVLTKGPVALLVLGLTLAVYLVLHRFRLKLTLSEAALFLLVLVFTGGFWFLLQIAKGNFSIIADFVTYQVRLFRTEDAGHGGFMLYHFIVLLAGVFPASFIALPSMFSSGKQESRQKDFRSWMAILFWVVLILFTIVKTKIVHYSSLCYFPLTYFAALTLYGFTPGRSSDRSPGQTILFIAVAAFALLLSVIVSLLVFIDSWKHILVEKGWTGDPFAQACLMADGGWKGFEVVAGLILLAGAVTGIILWKRGNRYRSLVMFFPVTTVFLFVAMVLIVPRVEMYSQHAAIEFFESVSGEDAYLKTLGYKSYAHYFYGKIKKQDHPLATDDDWLLSGDIDKMAYFAIKVNKRERFLDQYPELEVLYEKNGFVFCQRNPYH